jgi:pimeloyl-ACP methyl ester carboxylesterase
MVPAIRQTRSAIGTVIYWPGDREPRGGVVCLHGSEGGHAGWNDFNCAMLAANGFAAMAYRYTQASPAQPSADIDDVALDGAEAALLCLRAALSSDAKIGLFGVSRGAEHALLLAQLLAEDGAPRCPTRSRSIRRRTRPGPLISSPIS